MLSTYAVDVVAVEAGVQLLKLNVSVDVAENPAVPSNVAAVFAGDVLLFPDPEQVPEMVKLFDRPFATSALNPLCSGNEAVDAAGC